MDGKIDLFEALEPNLETLERDLSVIGNIIRLKILTLLYSSTDKMNFNQIARKLEVNRSKLSYHVLQLKKYDFISNEMREEREGKNFSYYAITEKGKKFLDIVQSLNKS